MASYKVQCSILYVLYCSTARSRYGIKCNMPCMFDDVPLLDLEEFKHQRELARLAGAEALLAMAAGYRPGLTDEDLDALRRLAGPDSWLFQSPRLAVDGWQQYKNQWVPPPPDGPPTWVIRGQGRPVGGVVVATAPSPPPSPSSVAVGVQDEEQGDGSAVVAYAVVDEELARARRFDSWAQSPAAWEHRWVRRAEIIGRWLG